MGLFRSIGARKDATRGTAPIEVRKGLAWLFTGAGVLPGADSPLVTGTAGWAYSVGKAGFVATRGASDGVHLFGNDGAVSIGATGVGSTVPAAPGAGLQRIDIAWVKHPAAGENADTISEPSFGVSSGGAASVALPPVIPTGALELARNLMTSAATTTASTGNSITQMALAAVAAGAPIPVKSQAERNALTAYDGLRVYRLDLHCAEVYNSALAIWTGAPTAYTPTFTAATTNPNIGTTGTIVGSYVLVGKQCRWRVAITTSGTGIAVGSGIYALSMPLTGAVTTQITGAGFIYTGTFKLFVTDGTATVRCLLTATGAQMDHTSGMTAVGNVLEASGAFDIT